MHRRLLFDNDNNVQRHAFEQFELDQLLWGRDGAQLDDPIPYPYPRAGYLRTL